MLLTYDSGIQDTGCGLQRVYCGIDSQFYDRTGQNRGGIQMCECGRRCRVCQVIRRHIDCLYGSNGSVLGGCDTLLQRTHLCL